MASEPIQSDYRPPILVLEINGGVTADSIRLFDGRIHTMSSHWHAWLEDSKPGDVLILSPGHYLVRLGRITDAD